MNRAYRSYVVRKWFVLAVLFSLLCICTIWSVSVGSTRLAIPDIATALIGEGDQHTMAIVWNIRLPRIATGIIVGAALAMAGCIMQNILRNPLASSSTLGVSQGASFGAAFAIVCLDTGTFVQASSAYSATVPYLITLCAFIGGFLTTALILGLSRFAQASPSSMILAGVALATLFGSGTAMIQYFADDVKVASVVYWTFGDLGRASWQEIQLTAGVSLLSMVYFFVNSWNYNAMESGTDTARSLGVSVNTLVLTSMVLCSLMASVATAFVGCINFIGLIAPHMVRKFVGNDHRFLIPASALMGALILVLSELASRTLVSPTILPIGALTSFLGTPMFLYLIFKRRNLI